MTENVAALPFGDRVPIRELHPWLCSPGLRLRRRPGGSAAPTLICSFNLVTSLQHWSEGSCWKPWVITEAGVLLCRRQVLTRKDVFFLLKACAHVRVRKETPVFACSQSCEQTCPATKEDHALWKEEWCGEPNDARAAVNMDSQQSSLSQ